MFRYRCEFLYVLSDESDWQISGGILVIKQFLDMHYKIVRRIKVIFVQCLGRDEQDWKGRIWGFPSGGYEEFYNQWQNAV
jgi:hypothetical protein